MSVTHSSPNQSQPEALRCVRCNAELPPFATFCGNCGERVKQEPGEVTPVKMIDLSSRYRITSLLRKQYPTQLFLALDMLQQRPVAIYDIDISHIDESRRTQAIATLQQEYDLLRHQRIPAIMPLVDLYYFNGHISVLSGWPYALPAQEQSNEISTEADKQPSTAATETTEASSSNKPIYKLTTLHDLLQSGIGLPTTEVALTWTARLCHALEQLHRHNILLGTIDPHTILVSQRSYDGEPVLIVSWLPDLLRELIPEPLNNAHVSPFRAPETLLGALAPYSDIYSLGAVLYLLLTGTSPANANERAHAPLDSLLDHDPYSNPVVSALVMQALAYKPEERFQNATTFSEALATLLPHTHITHTHIKGTAYASSLGKSKTDIHIASTPVDNEKDSLDKISSLEEEEDMTVAVVPLQAQMARRYLSRMKTEKFGLNDPFAGDISRGEEPHLKASVTPYEGEKQNQTEKAAESSEKNAGLLSAEKRIPSTQDNKIPEMHVEKPTTTTTDKDNVPAEQQEQQNRDKAEESANNPNPQEDITQLETILIKTDDMKLASALIGETGNQSRHIHNPVHHAGTSTGLEKPDQSVDEQISTSQGTGAEGLTHKHKSISRFIERLTSSLPRLLPPKSVEVAGRVQQGQTTPEESSLIKRIQHFLLGEHQHVTTAAALIETPLRVQPHQSYVMRINIVGRSPDRSESEGGLSAFSEGEVVHIEVRSALYQNYAYIVQQADVTIPAAGFVAEVSMPMQPLGSGPNGRRERLHIFFMDKDRNPLYEKPFVLELFISHLVQSGHEGHNVLSIPL